MRKSESLNKINYVLMHILCGNMFCNDVKFKKCVKIICKTLVVFELIKCVSNWSLLGYTLT